tara:strand:+ start:1051 stop:1176 length:126 start_codon:yes stop_codon:yes gene_type:complete
MDKTISYEQHFILVEYYQKKIQELEAKLEVQQINSNKYNEI